MKAITLWQPWASLLACGAKQFETRSWATSYRGPIAIHAAARKCESKDISRYAIHEIIQAIRPITSKLARTSMYLPLELLPRGAIVATAELVGCHLIVEPAGIDGMISTGKMLQGNLPVSVYGNELLFGDWAPGRYAWEFANMQMLPEPILTKGGQRIWNWQTTLAEAAQEED